MRHGRPSRPPCSASTQAKRARSSSIPNKEQALSSIPYKGALVVGTGPGISASLARQLSHAGLKVAVAARNIDKLRSEEHTSELQSLMRISYAVFCLKNKNNITLITIKTQHTDTNIRIISVKE